LDKVSYFFNEKLIFADFLKKKCRLISVVFPLLFFLWGRKRTTRREKKNQHLIKKSAKISFSLKKYPVSSGSFPSYLSTLSKVK
jgi:hypothetical protein